MAEQDIIVRVKAEGTDAFIKQLKAAGVAVEKVGDEAEEAEKKVEKTTSSMSSSFKKLRGVIAAAFATQQISQFIAESVKLADVQLKAEAQLLKGLKGRQDIQKRLIQQAKELQKVTTFGDEQIIAQQAYLANLEFTEKQIKDIIRASVDLSAGANIPLESSVRNLAKSYSGLSGELGELIPQLRDLTQDQLKNGEGVKVITELYEGQAQVLRTTGLGAVQSLQNAVGDLREELGKAVLEGLTPLADTLQDIANDQEVIDFFTAIGRAIGNSVKIVAQSIQGYTELFNILRGRSRQERAFAAEVAGIESERALAALQNRKEIERENLANERFAPKRRQQLNDEIELIKARRAELAAIRIEESLQLDETEEGIDGVKDAADPLNVTLSDLQKTTGDLSTSESELIRQLEALQDAFRETKSVADLFQESLLDGTGLQISATTQVLIDNVNELTEALKRRGFQTRKNKQEEQDSIEIQQERVAKAQEAFGAINQIQAASFDIFRAFQQKQLAELDQRFERGLISEKEYEQERRKILRKQARADKARAIFEATINIASGIARAVAASPLTGGLPFTAIVAAIGAAQIAAIAATPIPKFRKGTRMVGDGFELGEDRTLAYLNKGERVITSDKNKRHFRLYNAIEENDVNGMLLEMAKMGVAVQFNAGDALSGQISQMKTLSEITKGKKDKGINLDPLLSASDRQRVTLSRKLDQVNGNLIKLGSSLNRRMTQA